MLLFVVLIFCVFNIVSCSQLTQSDPDGGPQNGPPKDEVLEYQPYSPLFAFTKSSRPTVFSFINDGVALNVEQQLKMMIYKCDGKLSALFKENPSRIDVVFRNNDSDGNEIIEHEPVFGERIFLYSDYGIKEVCRQLSKQYIWSLPSELSSYQRQNLHQSLYWYDDGLSYYLSKLLLSSKDLSYLDVGGCSNFTYTNADLKDESFDRPHMSRIANTYLISYLIDLYGIEKVVQLFSELRKYNIDSAFAHITGLSINEFFESFATWHAIPFNCAKRISEFAIQKYIDDMSSAGTAVMRSENIVGSEKDVPIIYSNADKSKNVIVIDNQISETNNYLLQIKNIVNSSVDEQLLKKIKTSQYRNFEIPQSIGLRLFLDIYEKMWDLRFKLFKKKSNDVTYTQHDLLDEAITALIQETDASYIYNWGLFRDVQSFLISNYPAQNIKESMIKMLNDYSSNHKDIQNIFKDKSADSSFLITNLPMSFLDLFMRDNVLTNNYSLYSAPQILKHCSNTGDLGRLDSLYVNTVRHDLQKRLLESLSIYSTVLLQVDSGCKHKELYHLDRILDKSFFMKRTSDIAIEKN